MSIDNEILLHFGGLDKNSLNHVLSQDIDNEGDADSELEIIKKSSYYSNDNLIKEFKTKKDSFKILSVNCQSINSKIDQLKLNLHQVKQNECDFHAICLQETWLSDNSDTCLLQIEGYNLISQSKACTARGGLIIYLKNNKKSKLLDGITHSLKNLGRPIHRNYIRKHTRPEISTWQYL